MLEASLWESNCYLTLSYDDQSLPYVPTRLGMSGNTVQAAGANVVPSLMPSHLQLFLKRLRKAHPTPIRFYAVGEYGEKSWRPHYHIALFNFHTCTRSRTLRRPYKTRPEWFDCCPVCRLVGKTWGKGDVDLGTLEPSSAQYVAGYITKKMTGANDPRLDGRYPEFARMSLRPGVGFGILDRVAAVLSENGLNSMLPDVPAVLRHGKKQMPLGRYLRRKLRVKLDREEKCPDAVLATLQAEMQPLLSIAQEATSHPTMAKFRKEVIRNLIIDANIGVSWKIEADELRNKRRIL